MKISAGFTLLEMAIAMAIVGLLLGGMMMPLSAQMDGRRNTETQKLLDEINQALIGFAVNKGYLPCPDRTGAAGAGAANDGLEDVEATGSCAAQEGNIPWATLGVADVDAWGNRVRYSVTKAYSDRAPLTTFLLGSTGTLRVCQNAACTATLAIALPAVVLSHGKNGYGAINPSGSANQAPPAANIDERANADLNPDFVSRTPSPTGAAAGEYDDIVAWVSPNILFNRMVSAQKLP